MAASSNQIIGERTFGCYQISLSVSSDKLCLFLSLKPIADSEDPLPSDTIVQSLVTEISPTVKIAKHDRLAIANALETKQAIDELLIATGTAPIAGKDGRIVFLVKRFEQLKAGETIERLDHRFIRKFDNIEPEKAVVRRYPPINGVEGKDVFGEVIPPAIGNPAELKFDSTLELRTVEGNHAFEVLVAKQSGYLDSDKGALTIRQQLKIEGDIDHRTGDIEFIGSVTVTGSVMKDYSVIARGDIKIEKDVVSGTVISQQGSVFIGGNVGGNSSEKGGTDKASSGALQRRELRKRPQIRAKGSFQALAIDDSDIEAGGMINITGDIRNCYVRTHEVLIIAEGSLLGGKTYAVKGIEGAVIGSHQESRTQIFIVNDLEASAKYAEMQQQLVRHRAAEQLVRLYLGPYHHTDIDLSSLDKHFRERIVELQLKLKLTKQSIQSLESLCEKLLAEQIENPTFQLNFAKVFHVGVEISDKDISFSVDKQLVGPRTIIYNATQQMFGILDFQPLEIEKEKKDE